MSFWIGKKGVSESHLEAVLGLSGLLLDCFWTASGSASGGKKLLLFPPFQIHAIWEGLWNTAKWGKLEDMVKKIEKEEVLVDSFISGESSKAARQAINHSSITQIQKETGVTAIN